MGGVPILLLLAAAGVGYGWSRDGQGGVEYVIQVTPAQLDDVRRAGEISSALPSEVCGSVSRVVVCVGDGPLEREGVETVMKPDPQGTSPGFGNGFNLPNEAADAMNRSMQNATSRLDELANEITDQGRQAIDQGRQTVDDAINRTGDMMSSSAQRTLSLGPPPSNGPATNRQGSVQSPAGVRSGGPSTAPVSASHTWYGTEAANNLRMNGAASGNPGALQVPGTAGQLAVQQSGQQSGQRPGTAGGQANAASSASGFHSVPQFNASTSATGIPNNGMRPNAASGGLGTTEHFGRLPGAQFPSSGQAAPPRQDATGQFSMTSPTTNNGSAGSLGNNPSMYGGTMSGSQAGPGSAAANHHVGSQLPMDNTRNPWAGNPVNSAAQHNVAAGHPNANYGGQVPGYPSRPDVTGRPAPTHALNYQQNNPGDTRFIGEDFDQAPMQRGSAGGFASSQLDFPRPARPSTDDRIADRSQSGVADRARSGDDDHLGRSGGPTAAASASDRIPETRSLGGTPVDSSTTYGGSSQPLFNALLLFSVVANVYLFFWLKSLREQFHDNVAAKRIVKSGSSA